MASVFLRKVRIHLQCQSTSGECILSLIRTANGILRLPETQKLSPDDTRLGYQIETVEDLIHNQG